MGDHREWTVGLLKRIGEEGDEVANWWSAFSRIAKRYISPYIEEVGGKIDDSYLNEMIEKVNKFYICEGYSLHHRIEYVLSQFSWDIFKLLDIFLRAADVEYRSLRAGDELGRDLLLVESELMINIYGYDTWYRIRKKSGIREFLAIPEDQIGYLILDVAPHACARDIEDLLEFCKTFYKTMIIFGYKDKMDPQLENLLMSHGCRCIRRIVNDNVVIIFAKRMKERAKLSEEGDFV